MSASSGRSYERLIIMNQILSGSFGRHNSANKSFFESKQEQGRRTLLQYLTSPLPESHYERPLISASILRFLTTF